MDGEKVSIPYSRVASKIGLEKGDGTFDVNISGGKNYEVRLNILGVVKETKIKGS